MNKTKLIGILTAIVATSSMIGIIMISDNQPAHAEPKAGPQDVVVLSCDPVGTPVMLGTVFASSSANAPAVAVGGASCAQNLADFLDAGFEIVNISDPVASVERFYYTLVR